MTTKTDLQLHQDILDELAWDPSVDASHILIQVIDGNAVMTGSVPSYPEIFKAKHATRRISGLKSVTMQVEVNLDETSKRTDKEIARTASEVLKSNSVLQASPVSATVVNGSVVLSGSVNWEYQRQAADEAIDHIIGICAIDNNIILNPLPATGDVRLKIELALLRYGHAKDALNISARADGGKITLKGFVHSLRERQTALDAAWSAPGVTEVIDNILIEAPRERSDTDRFIT